MDSITLLFEQEIDIGLPLSGYRLIPGYKGEAGLPLEAFLHLYAVNDAGERVLIAGPNDLSPLVERVSSEEAAWRFLRLFTAPATHYLFEKNTYVIDIRVREAGEEAAIGTISPEVARSVGYQPPQMRLEDDEYIAQRDLARVDAARPSGPATLLRRREALSQAGVYRFIEDRVVGEIERKNVYIPYYE
jgi:hypothetical protein